MGLCFAQYCSSSGEWSSNSRRGDQRLRHELGDLSAALPPEAWHVGQLQGKITLGRRYATHVIQVGGRLRPF